MEAIRILAYLLRSAPLLPRFSDENMVRIHEQVEEVDIGSGVSSTWKGGR